MARPFDSRTSDQGAVLRALGAVMVVGGAAIRILPDVGTIDPVRRFTGVPCPFAGMTTGTLKLAEGDIVGSIAANPAAILLVGAVVVAFVPAIYRSGWFRASWSRIRFAAPLLVGLALPLLWLWELSRFDII